VEDSRHVVWTDQRDLLGSSQTNTHFVVEIDDDGIGHLRFGRDDAASTLVPGSTFGARYRVGIGRSGHIGADMLRHVVFDEGFVDGVTVSNPLAADGGIDPERSDDVKRFAPHAFRSEMLRAITPEDYAALAQAPHEPRVQRAQARFLWTGSWYEVAVSIDPVADVPEKELDALARSVERHLRRYRRIGHDVRVRIARSVPLDLVMRVCVKPDFLRGHVEAALLDALSNRLLPDGRTGFFYPDNLTLGEGIAVSRIVAAAQSVEGVYSVEVERLRRKFEPAGNALEIGILHVQPWEMPRLDNDPSMPDNGTLKLKMRGGR
jgi:predicted phage baseplate assembly protein